MVHASRGRNAPALPLPRSEAAIVAGMTAAVLGSRSSVRWNRLVEDCARIRGLIGRVFPSFGGYKARIAQPGGFHLSSTARERSWRTESSRANFMVFKGLQVVPYALPDDCCGASYPEANPLIPLSHHDLDSGTPGAKSIPVRLCAHGGHPMGQLLLSRMQFALPSASPPSWRC